jgi:hypothetical protein
MSMLEGIMCLTEQRLLLPKDPIFTIHQKKHLTPIKFNDLTYSFQGIYTIKSQSDKIASAKKSGTCSFLKELIIPSIISIVSSFYFTSAYTPYISLHPLQILLQWVL